MAANNQSPPPVELFDLLNLSNNERDIAKFDEESVSLAVHRDPNAARRKYHFGMGYYGRFFGRRLHPLAQAVMLGASPKLVQLLHDIHPEAIRTADSDGWTPLHFACYYGAKVEVVLLLVRLYPAAVEMTDVDGCSPLHWACFHKYPSVEVVWMLAERFPHAMSMKDNGGDTPLMLATKKRAPTEIIDLLTTMHTLFCIQTTDEDVTELLLESRGKIWSSHVVPILHLRTSVVHRVGVDVVLMVMVLGRVGQEGRLLTMFQIVRESMNLFGKV